MTNYRLKLEGGGGRKVPGEAGHDIAFTVRCGACKGTGAAHEWTIDGYLVQVEPPTPCHLCEGKGVLTQ